MDALTKKVTLASRKKNCRLPKVHSALMEMSGSVQQETLDFNYHVTPRQPPVWKGRVIVVMLF